MNKRFFIALVALNAVLLSLAIWLYNGHFLIWQYPLSYAGMARTLDGLPNDPARIVFAGSFLVSGLIMAILCVRSLVHKKEPRVTGWLYGMGAVGFLLGGLSPDDIRHPTHVLGCALVIASLWVIASADVQNALPFMPRRRWYLTLVLLQLPIFAYALTYFFQLDEINGILQKFAFVFLGYVLITTTDYPPSRG